MSKYQFALLGDCKKDSDVEWVKKKVMGNSQNRVDFILVYSANITLRRGVI